MTHIHSATRRSTPMGAPRKPPSAVDRLRALPRSARWGALLAVAGLAILATYLVSLGHSAEKVNLFAYSLTPIQLQECSRRLGQLGIAHKPNSDNNNLMVDESQKMSLLGQLSLEGLPHDDPSARPNANPLTPTRREALLRSQAELQMRLAASLRSMRGIAEASVQLAIPEEGAFVDNNRASASVLLRMAQGYELSRGQAHGIAKFVAGAVPDLEPDQVTVLDDSGRDYSQSGEAANDLQLELQKQVDLYLCAKAQRILDLAYGREAALVVVNAELDFSQIEVKHVDFGQPGQGEVISVLQKTDEDYSRQGEEENPGKKYGKHSIAEKHQTDEASTWTVHKLPRIARVTCSVLLEHKGQEDTALALVQGAIGFDASRGDSIQVKAVPLHHDLGGLKGISALVTPTVPAAPNQPLWGWLGAAGALLSCGVGGIWWLGRRQIRQQPRLQPVPLQPLQGPCDLSHNARGENLVRETQTEPQVLQRLEELARQAPKETAFKLRTYFDSEN